MIMSYPSGTCSGSTGITTVECHKQVRSWRLLCFLAELFIPICHCFIPREIQEPKFHGNKHHPYYNLYRSPSLIPSSTVTGTLFGNRHGRVSFCIQTNPKSIAPLLLLQLAIPTNILAKEMKGGYVRIAFECKTTAATPAPTATRRNMCTSSLLSMPSWSMLCNGRKVGFAVKRKPSRDDMEILQQLATIVSGAGIVRQEYDRVMYLRGEFERFCGSSNSESFHMVDPGDDGNINGQELSFYFTRFR